MKISKRKPTKGPNPKDYIQKPKQTAVEMKPSTSCKRRKTAKDKKKEDRQNEQDDFLLFLKQNSEEEQH